MNWRMNATSQRTWRMTLLCLTAGLICGCWLAPTLATAADGRRQAARGEIVAARGEAAAPPSANAEETTSVYYLNYVKAADVAETIAPMLEAGHINAKIVPEPRINGIIVHAPMQSQLIVGQMIRAFDVSPDGTAAKESTTDRAGKIVERMAQKLQEIGKAGPEGTEPVTTIYQLGHADVKTVAQLLVRILSNLDAASGVQLKVVPAQEMKAIMIMAPGPVQADMALLIEALDVPPRPVAEPEMRVFQLEHADSGQVAQLLMGLFNQTNVRVSASSQGSLVVQAPADVFGRITRIVSEVDTAGMGQGQRVIRNNIPAEEEALPTHRVRIIWLANVPSDRPAGLPDDLKPVMAELSSVGVSDLRMIGQAIVNTGADGIFRTSSAPMWKGEPATLTIEGRLKIEKGMRSLKINLVAEQMTTAVDDPATPYRGGPMPFNQTLFDLNTTLAAPAGHFVVLGVTPTGETTSAFVVQITPVE